MNTLEGILKNSIKSPGTKSTGIIITDPDLLKQAGEWIAADSAVETAESLRTSIDLTFKPALRRAWFASNAGRAKPESSLKLVTAAGQITVSFAAQWFPKGELATLLPPPLLRKKCELKVDVSKIPEDKQNEVVNDLVQALARHGCEGALTAKLVDYPREEFASARHVQFTPEQNEQFELSGLGTRVSLRR